MLLFNLPTLISKKAEEWYNSNQLLCDLSRILCSVIVACVGWKSDYLTRIFQWIAKKIYQLLQSARIIQDYDQRIKDYKKMNEALLLEIDTLQDKIDQELDLVN